jgi:hypothetical protein
MTDAEKDVKAALRERLLPKAEQLAVNQSLLVNKLNAAAVVTLAVIPPITEEHFVEVARIAYQAAHREWARATESYLAKWTRMPTEPEPEPAAHPPEVQGRGP